MCVPLAGCGHAYTYHQLQVGYASSGLRGEVSAKVKELFALMTGIPGKLSVDEIIDVVKWLLSDSNYMYGDLDIKVTSSLYHTDSRLT